MKGRESGTDIFKGYKVPSVGHTARQGEALPWQHKVVRVTFLFAPGINLCVFVNQVNIL